MSNAYPRARSALPPDQGMVADNRSSSSSSACAPAHLAFGSSPSGATCVKSAPYAYNPLEHSTSLGWQQSLMGATDVDLGADPSAADVGGSSHGGRVVHNNLDGGSMPQQSKTYRMAVKRTVMSIALSCGFGLATMLFRGRQSGLEFFAGYLVEQSLSVDNLFVFLMTFDYFQVPLEHQGRVLTWGIVGAILMRGVMIAFGVAAVK
ncbi:unnamed protein product, partial [Ectocarpus sp. 12 AP-2014]